jgi:hypothetical protein
VKKSHTKADTIWSADIVVRSGGSAELLIVDEKSGRAIVRTPVDMTDVTSGTEALRKVFETHGTPLEVRTDAGFFFTGTAVRALLDSLGVAHTVVVVGRNRAERQARS